MKYNKNPMKKTILYSILIVLFSSCSNSLEKKAAEIAKNYCDCCTNILNDTLDIVEKKSKLENCSYDFLFLTYSVDKNDQEELMNLVFEKIYKECEDCFAFEDMY